MSVELVLRADQRRRWHELGRVLFADEPRWAPPLTSYERWLFSRRHPYRRAGAEIERWLARRGGEVIGRIAAHRAPGDAVAWFGGFECADDVGAVAALVDAVREWADPLPLRGPALFHPADGDAGVLVEGFEHAGGTGRSWHPPTYAEHLAAAGLVPTGERFERWRTPTTGVQQTDASVGLVHTSRLVLPPHAGKLADPALVLPGIAAVPDVAAALRRYTQVDAAVVRCDGDAAALVPALRSAAAERGYAYVWCPVGEGPPDTVHELVADRNHLP